MDKRPSMLQNLSPVVIGGVGGSGTRLIAECLKESGFYIGTDLNESNDNLWFTLLFKRIEILSLSEKKFDNLVEIFVKIMTGRIDFKRQQIELIQALLSEDGRWAAKNVLRKRVANLSVFGNQEIKEADKWGWKEPNSHIVLDRLISRFPNMKYIHVIRNGLDMAYSKNQNQLKLWGSHFLKEPFDITPYYSLRYWCAVHKCLIHIGELMKDNFLLLNYDHLCVDPQKEIEQLLKFLNKKPDSLAVQLMTLVKPSGSIGRFQQYDTKIFAEEDVAFVKLLGFNTNAMFDF